MYNNNTCTDEFTKIVRQCGNSFQYTTMYNNNTCTDEFTKIVRQYVVKIEARNVLFLLGEVSY